MKRDGSESRQQLPDADGKKLAIVCARFYPELADQMVAGARRAALECGIKDADIVEVHVPGCFELPLAVRRVFMRDEPDAVVAIGIIVRGETPHFDYVAAETSRGLMSLQLTSGVPIGFGVLTTDTLEQAAVRADPKQGDKGYEAAIAALSLLAIEKKESSPIGFRR